MPKSSKVDGIITMKLEIELNLIDCGGEAHEEHK